MRATRREAITGWLEIATGIGMAIFWLLFFTRGLAPANPPACYLAFEHAFLLPDLILSGSLVIAGWLLANGRPWGRLLSLPCAGGLVFLGVVDFSFNVLNGVYVGHALEGAGNALINFWCVGFGIAIVVVVGPPAELPPHAGKRKGGTVGRADPGIQHG